MFVGALALRLTSRRLSPCYNHLYIVCCLGGLMYVRQWNNMQYVSSAAFLLAVYSDYLSQAKVVVNCPEGAVKPQELFDFAKSQVSTVNLHSFLSLAVNKNIYLFIY